MDAIIQAISAIFEGADAHDWSRVQAAMADNVLLDYSSLSGNPAATLAASQIVDAWKNFLPGFDKTRHQLSNFQVMQDGNKATAHFSGKADHFIDADIWTVAGTYDTELTMTSNQWHVTMLHFNLQQQSGNTELPGRAAKIMAEQ